MKLVLVQDREVSYQDNEGEMHTSKVPYTIEGHIDNAGDLATITSLVMRYFDSISIVVNKED